MAFTGQFTACKQYGASILKALPDLEEEAGDRVRAEMGAILSVIFRKSTGRPMWLRVHGLERCSDSTSGMVKFSLSVVVALVNPDDAEAGDYVTDDAVSGWTTHNQFDPEVEPLSFSALGKVFQSEYLLGDRMWKRVS